MTIKLSKTKFIAGCQCLKRLYLQVHEPELAAEPDGAVEAIIEQGHEVGLLARRLFPGGIEVRSDGGLDQAIRATRELVANPAVSAIFEGVFEHGNVLVKVDVLQRRRDGRWKLIEVKSTTDLRDHHLEDVAIQYRVVSGSGLDVALACLAHVNRDYVYPGGEIDPQGFFRIRNVTRRVEGLQHKLMSQLRSEFRILAQPTPPNINIGAHCTAPVICEFFDHCNPPRPQDHVGFLPRIRASAVDALEEMGVESIQDIPQDFELSDIQRRAATCVQTGQPWFDNDGLRAKLESLIYPVAYLDFETINWAIPRFSGTRPYQQIPFQWSAHIQHQPGAEPQHYEFLASDASDPRCNFVTSLCAALPEEGSVVVYNQQFESARCDELAASLPEFAERIKNFQSRLWDLLPVVRTHLYHPVFRGSYSLKSVLPALVPKMTYDAMEVADGRGAGLAWEKLIRDNLDKAENERITRALLDYCGQDTLGMVKLVEELQRERTDANNRRHS